MQTIFLMECKGHLTAKPRLFLESKVGSEFEQKTLPVQCFFFFHDLTSFRTLVCSLSTAVSAYVEAYDALISGPIAEYVTLSQKIGGDVLKHVCKAVLTDQPSDPQFM